MYPPSGDEPPSASDGASISGSFVYNTSQFYAPFDLPAWALISITGTVTFPSSSGVGSAAIIALSPYTPGVAERIGGYQPYDNLFYPLGLVPDGLDFNGWQFTVESDSGPLVINVFSTGNIDDGSSGDVSFVASNFQGSACGGCMLSSCGPQLSCPASPSSCTVLTGPTSSSSSSSSASPAIPPSSGTITTSTTSSGIIAPTASSSTTIAAAYSSSSAVPSELKECSFHLVYPSGGDSASDGAAINGSFVYNSSLYYFTPIDLGAWALVSISGTVTFPTSSGLESAAIIGLSPYTPGGAAESVGGIQFYDNLLYPFGGVPDLLDEYGWQFTVESDSGPLAIHVFATEDIDNYASGDVSFVPSNYQGSACGGCMLSSCNLRLTCSTTPLSCTPETGPASSAPPSSSSSSSASPSSSSALSPSSSSSSPPAILPTAASSIPSATSAASSVSSASAASNSTTLPPYTGPLTTCSFDVKYSAGSGGISGTFSYDPTVSTAGPYDAGYHTGHALISIGGTVTLPVNGTTYTITGLLPVPATTGFASPPYDNIYFPYAGICINPLGGLRPGVQACTTPGNSLDVNGWQFDVALSTDDTVTQQVHVYATRGGTQPLNSISFTTSVTGSSSGGGTFQLGTCTTYIPPATLSAPMVFPLTSNCNQSTVLIFNDVPGGNSYVVTAQQPLGSSGNGTYSLITSPTFPANLSQFAAVTGQFGITDRSPSAYLIGGFDSSTQALSNAVWTSTNGSTWHLLSQSSNSIFSPRSKAGLVSLLGGFVAPGIPQLPSPLVLMGGATGVSSVVNDVWLSIDLAVTWTQVTDSAAFSARAGHAVAVEAGAQCAAGCILLVGGLDITGTALNDVWLSSDSGTSFRQLTSAAAFRGRTGAQLTVSASVTDEPVYGESSAPGGYLTVLAGGTSSIGALPSDASAWLSYDGGWSWDPLLPATSSAYPLSFAQAAPFFDSLGALVFLGVQPLQNGLPAAPSGPGEQVLQTSVINNGVISSTALSSALNGASLSASCFYGLNCFPAPTSGSDTTEQWLNGTLITTGNNSQVTCGYISSGCQCASYAATLAASPSYWSVTGSTSEFGLGDSFQVSCTTNASLAADGYLFDSTSAPFQPYIVQCMAGGVYNSALPSTSYCTSSYIAEQGSTYTCTPVYGGRTTTVQSTLCGPVQAEQVAELRNPSCVYTCGCAWDLTSIGAEPLIYEWNTTVTASINATIHFALTLCTYDSTTTFGAVQAALNSFGAATEATLSSYVQELESSSYEGATVSEGPHSPQRCAHDSSGVASCTDAVLLHLSSFVTCVCRWLLWRTTRSTTIEADSPT